MDDESANAREEASADNAETGSIGERIIGGRGQRLEPMPASHPERIGRYVIRRTIASGGMGTVYEAVQENPRRAVALKVMRGGIASATALRRFEYESQILARLRHPNIAQVYEAGQYDDGNGSAPYFAMEYIPNALTITDHAINRNLGTRERLALFVKVCDAVHHGHQKGIIHRDLKPGNILVDPAGEPKIIDFGVARATDSDLAATMLQTNAGQMIGTLQYMSPEQCEADPDNLDTRSDVYALGVVLYELLCERPPYNLSRASIHEAARLICEAPPTRLSSVDRMLRGDVETIALKALEKDRDRRYQSAADLGHDIERYLRNEPIEARPPSAFYQLRKFSVRHRGVVIAIGFIVFAVCVGLFGTTFMYARAAREREAAVDAQIDAERARDDLSVVANFQAAMIESINPEVMGINLIASLREHVRAGLRETGRDDTAIEQAMADLSGIAATINETDFARDVVDRNILQRAAAMAEEEFADQPLIEATIRATIGRTYFAIGRADLAEPHTRRARDLRREHLGENAPETFTTGNDLALVLTNLARYDEAGSLIDAILTKQESILGRDHAITLGTRTNLAILRRAQNRFDDSERLFKEIIDARLRLFGEKDQATAAAMNNLAVLYESLSRTEEAEELFERALGIYEGALGVTHASTLSTMNNLGQIYHASGRFDDAEQILERALGIQRRVLGNEHPDTLATIGNLGALRNAQGRFDDAEPLLKEVYETENRLRGERHPDTMLSLTNLGALYNSMQAFDRAAPLLERMLDLQRESLGADDELALSTANNLAYAYEMSDRLAEAETMYADVLATRRHTLGDSHLSTMISMYNLGRLHMTQNDLASAETLLAGAVNLARAHLPENHWATPVFLGGYGECLTTLGRYADAEQTLLEAYPRLLEVFGREHERIRDAINRFITLYERSDQPDKADEWRARLEE